VAVAAFLEGALSFTTIPRVIEQALEAYGGLPADSIHEVRELDLWAHQHARTLVVDAGRRLKLGV
jgi:1-deoxy-D-xylulose 5-phosphate reductoisomerase